MRLDGKTALVTGGGRGLGRAMVLGPRTSLGRPELVQIVFQSVIEPASIRQVAAHVAHMAAKALHM